MSYAALIERTWRENILYSVLIELTYDCNWDCFFCYNDVTLQGRRLTKEDYFRVLGELRDMNVMSVTLSGGEPLAHPDFFAIGMKARELGFVVRVKSNAHALRGHVAERMKREVAPHVIEVSLHGAKAETHERQTRVAGSFTRLLENLRAGRALGLKFKINSTLTRWNEDEIEEMFALADDLGMPLRFDPDVTPRDDGDTEPQSIACTDAGLLRLLQVQSARHLHAARAATELARRAPAAETVPAIAPIPPAATPEASCGGGGEKHCGAGSSSLCIDPFGNTYPCVQWRRSVGNVHTQSLSEIWRGSAVLDEVRGLGVEVKKLVDGHGARGAAMGFCPGMASTQTGSPLKIYPAAARKANAHRPSEAPLVAHRSSLPILP